VPKRRLLLWFQLALFPVVAYIAWLQVAKQAKTADGMLTATLQPRREVIASGYVKNAGASAFSLEKLLIEEPGREPYERQVALDSDRKFELVLGEPKPGAYRLALWLRSANLWGGSSQRWLRLPQLTIPAGPLREEKTVRAVDYDDRHVALFAAAVTAAGVWLFYYAARRSAKSTGQVIA
jgi:hypothetical protein